MFMYVYDFLWTLILVIVAPVFLLSRNRRISERMAFRLPEVVLGRGNIWIHALSVGEVISAVPLVRALKKQFPRRDIVFSVSTAKGMIIARDQLGEMVKALVTMPVDAWWCVRRIVDCVKPSVFVVVETDIWPGLLNFLGSRGIRSFLVNGRVSPRTYRAYRMFPLVVRKMYQPLEMCLMQSGLDSKRLLALGIGPERVKTVGNIKFDRNWEPMEQPERKEWIGQLAIEPRTILWVAGSTHPGEECSILHVFRRLYASFKGLRLILAPRDTGRSNEIFTLCQEMGLNAVLRTALLRNRVSYDVLVLDTLGELGRVYGLSTLSFVGGSLVPVGGHNLLEPASFGCPVLFGPYTHNFVAMSESLTAAGGGIRVKDAEDLFERMRALLSNGEMRNRVGRLARGFVERNRGALDQVISIVANGLPVGSEGSR